MEFFWIEWFSYRSFFFFFFFHEGFLQDENQSSMMAFDPIFDDQSSREINLLAQK